MRFCSIWFVDLVESKMMHGLADPKYKDTSQTA
jgi:hypothetical protein